MLEHYFVKPDTVDAIRELWIGEPIERYVAWLAERGYRDRTVLRRVPILKQFVEFARVVNGAVSWDQLHSCSQPRTGQSVQMVEVRRNDSGLGTAR